MADNITILTADGETVTLRTVEVDGVQYGVSIVAVSDGSLLGGPSALPVSISSAVNLALEGDDVTQENPLPVTQRKAGWADVTTMDVDDTATTLLVANTSRLNATFHNHSDDAIYLKLGTGVTDTSWTQVLNAHEYYELPFPGLYDGEITAMRPTGSESAPVMITELLTAAPDEG